MRQFWQTLPQVSRGFTIRWGLFFLISFIIGFLLWIKYQQRPSPFVPVWKVQHGIGDVLSVAFSSDGQLLVSSGWDGTTKFWRVKDGGLVRTLGIGANSLSFSPDGRILATGGEVIKLWRVSDGCLLRTLKDKNVRDNSPITFSPDGQFIASGGGFVEEIKPDIWTYVGGGIKVWRVKDGLLIKTLMDPTKPVRSVAFSPDGEFLASGHDDGAIRIWEFPEGNLAHVLTGHKGDVSSVAFSPDGEILASGGDDGTIRLWWILEGKTKTLLTSGAKVNLETLLTHGIGVYLLRLLDPIPLDVESIAFSPNGKLLASEGRDGVLELWRMPDGQRIGKWSFGWKWGLAQIVPSYTVAFSPDGQLVAVGDEQGFVNLLRLSLGE